MCTSGYMHLSLIPKQVYLLRTAHAVNSPVQSKCHRTIYGNGLFAYRPTAALIGYVAPVCVDSMGSNRILQNLLHS
jgi:hypothetical protein